MEFVRTSFNSLGGGSTSFFEVFTAKNCQASMQLERGLFAIAIVASSFLIFLVQPIMAKQILPWFGGAAGVWNTCLFFFQFVLLLGYVYAHALVRWLSPKQQVCVHIGLVVLSCMSLPIAASIGWKTGEVEPALRILLLLSATVGLPYFVLASTSPLLQAWYSRFQTAPYWLFSLSNAASLAGLLAYPFVLEPRLTVSDQAKYWSAGFLVFGAISAIVALFGIARLRPGHGGPTIRPRDKTSNAAATEKATWVLLSALSSLLLVSMTSFISQNIASVPLIWVVPLSIYLITFVIAFAGGQFGGRAIGGPALAFGLAIAVIYRTEDWISAFYWSLPVFLLGLFFVCLYCHGRLAATKPDPSGLTEFYVLVSLGGALGSLTGSILAPLMLNADFEMVFALSAVGAMFALQQRQDKRIWRFGAFGLAAAIIIVSGFQIIREIQSARVLARNFYSSLRIVDIGPSTGRWRRMEHGQIEHGAQFLDPARRGEPISYYGRSSGVGLAIARQRGLSSGQPLSIGVIGLGAGVIAAYGERGDRIRFYEINPQVVDLAYREFSYLADSKANISVALGDARLVLDQEPPQHFDIMIVDAFSGDAIPMHLLTREAINIYRKHLTDRGALLFHISNKFIDLEPALARLAIEEQLEARIATDEPDTEDGLTPFADSDWVVLVTDPQWFESSELAESMVELDVPHEGPAWTDDFNNLWSAVRLER